MGKENEVAGSLDEAELGELIQHLQAEEEASRQGTLESVESLQLWMTNHPALRQMVIVDSIAAIGPAILRFLRALLGLDKAQQDAPDVGKANQAD